MSGSTYSGHLEIPQDTSSLSTFDTSVANLCRTSVAMHLGQLKLCLGACSGWKGHVANDVSKSLSIKDSKSVLELRITESNTGVVRRAHTSQSHVQQRPYAWYGREQSWCWWNSPNRASSRGTSTYWWDLTTINVNCVVFDLWLLVVVNSVDHTIEALNDLRLERLDCRSATKYFRRIKVVPRNFPACYRWSLLDLTTRFT